MKRNDITLHDGESGSALAVRIQPGANHNAVRNVLGDGTIEIKLEDGGGNLNQALRGYLAHLLQISKSRINIIAGQTKTEKLVSIIDLEPDRVQDIILENVKK